MCRLRGARVCRLRGACVCICARGTRCKYCRGAVYALSLRRTRAVSCIDVAGVGVRRKRMRKDSCRIVARCRYSVLEVPFLGPIHNLFVLRFASRTTARRSFRSRAGRRLLDSTRLERACTVGCRSVAHVKQRVLFTGGASDVSK